MNEQKDRDDTDDDRREGQISYNPGARDPPLGGTQEHRYNEECEQRDTVTVVVRCDGMG